MVVPKTVFPMLYFTSMFCCPCPVYGKFFVNHIFCKSPLTFLKMSAILKCKYCVCYIIIQVINVIHVLRKTWPYSEQLGWSNNKNEEGGQKKDERPKERGWDAMPPNRKIGEKLDEMGRPLGTHATIYCC